MKQLIKNIFSFFRKKQKPTPIYYLPTPKPELSSEDWSGDDYLFNKPLSSRKTIIRTKGKVHNIKKIFDRLNKEHFEGKIKAKITYGRYGCRNVKRRRRITFGTYSSSELLIRIHPTLDSKEVPECFVEHVIHHEILHEVFPPIHGAYRRQVHHYDFRVAEAATPTYKEAMKWERENLKIFFRDPKIK
ncbi:MAG TPA: hypothetical protein VN026_12795 [Bacteroidia bacterium]|jgi:hypothetical protein|nr:hypothetical protein [Bacteroidia bacterium]